MYLKFIELENFKSFGKSTKIPFLEGYSSITGPNGSGKSNISDAILFVLGPKSSRAIRAGRLPDLIFNGGKNKKKAKSCKVSLIFNNADRIIPIDADEVKLTRKVKLSLSNKDAYSSYFYVNDKKSTLSEFDSLLANAQISADGYNFVQQGDINKIVSMSNVERRMILDDIAGITQFDRDIGKAEKEKEEVEDNLNRIGIILNEITKQLKQLEKDRVAALEYKEIRDRLELSKAQMTYKKKEQVEEEINSINRQIAKYEEEKEGSKRRREKLEKKLEEVKVELFKLEDEIAEKSDEESKELKKKIDDLRIKLALAQDGVETAKEDVKHLKKEKVETKNETADIKRELDKLLKEKQNVERSLIEKRKQLHLNEKEMMEAEKETAKSDIHIIKLQKDILRIKKKIESKEEELKKFTLEEDRLEEKIERLHLEIAEMEEGKKERDFQINDGDWRLRELKKEAKSAEKSIKDLERKRLTKKEEWGELIQQSRELDSAVKGLNKEFNQLKAEEEAIQSIRRGYNRAVQAIMEARDLGKIRGICGTIAELADVEEKCEIALNVAAGNRMQAIVVENDECASNSIKYLKEKKIGRATFLPLNKMLGGRPRGKSLMAVKDSIGFAIDLVKFDEKYRNAFWYVFRDTMVVDNLTNARKLMGGVRIVTLDGELIESSGAMVGGILEKGLLKFGASDKSVIKEVRKKLRSANEQAEKIDKRIRELEIEISRIGEELKEEKERYEGANIKINAIQAQHSTFKSNFDKLKDGYAKKRSELKKKEEEIKEVKENAAVLKNDIEGLKSEKEKINKKIMESTPEELAQRLKALQKRIAQLTNDVATSNASFETLTAQIKMHEERREEHSERTAGIDDQLKALNEKIKNDGESGRTLENQLRALLKVEESMGKEIKDVREKRDRMYKDKTEQENEIDKLLHKMETTDDFILGLNTKFQVVEKELDNLTEELEGKIEVTGKIPSLSELKKTIQECEVSMGALGAVNMRALENYDEQMKRCDELRGELERLKNQKKNLIKLVKELDDKKKCGLLRVFEGINDNFKEVYKELSDGGEAELILENEEKPFEGGLIIKARPKHRKTLRLEALSGGEKSLVSMGFIFGIQQFQPSPFYLLDEIDQNLDAINAENVARMVRRNSASAQFLQISLRKVTLKEADHILGVTMQNNGISNVVMEVNLNDVKEQEETSAEDKAVYENEVRR
jgi:chromosome segregation protein